jgi:hypothetical protein
LSTILVDEALHCLAGSQVTLGLSLYCLVGFAFLWRMLMEEKLVPRTMLSAISRPARHRAVSKANTRRKAAVFSYNT